MANGRNRRQTRSALDRMARVQRFAGVGTYDYGPAAAITTDFGQIARDNLQDFRNVQETARKARERIDAAQKEASEAQDYEFTGIAGVDGATMSIASSYRDHLREERNNIGKIVDGKLYTISDFVAFKNNVINNSKIWKGHPELINKTLERMREAKVDPLVIESYAMNAGLVLNPGGAYNVGSSRDPKNKGNIVITGENADGTKVEFDMKNMAVNGIQEFGVFDAQADILDFQKIYANQQQNFEIDGEMYSAEEVMDNPILFTKHVKGQTPEFEQSKETYLNNFAKEDIKVLSFLRQLGTKVEYSHSDYEKLSEKEKANFDKIYLNKKGRFVINKSLRDKARESLSKRLDGAFGTKTEGKAQVMRNYDEMRSTGTATPIKLPAINQLMETRALKAGEGPGQKYGPLSLIDSFRNAMTVSKGEIEGSQFKDLGQKFEVGSKFIDTSTLGKMLPEHIGRNADLFLNLGGANQKTDPPVIRQYGFSTTDPIEVEDQIKKGNIDMQGFAMGLDLTKTDLDALNITATKPGASQSLGSRFSSISGMSFTYSRVDKDKVNVGSVDQAKEMNLEDDYPRRIIGLRLVGPIDTNVQQKVEGGRGLTKDTTGDIISTETKDTAVKEAGSISTSDLVSESQIPQLVELIGKKQPYFEQLYKEAMTQSGAYPVQALYVAVQKAQRMQNQLVVQ